MRLLQLRDNNELTITNDLINDHPPYAILSHTWGRAGEEVTFQELTEKRGRGKAGYQKIVFCGEQAKHDGLQYFWVDTCCIDKTSSAELSEAINSMFAWYRNAQKCYVYLSDVAKVNDDGADELSRSTWKSAFRESRWFTRGWTLQELTAPSQVEFFSSDYQRLGDKKSLEVTIKEITRIPVRAIQGHPSTEFTIDERISWSNVRRTTRPEDRAYSLLGILGVNMPLIYGEGEESAFRRIRIVTNQNAELYPGQISHARGRTEGSHYYIPFPKNKKFTGRDKILADIQERLFGDESCQRLAVVGLGGMGKTQVALQLAYWVKEHQPQYSVLWIPALSPESFEQAVAEIARRLGIKKETADEDIKTVLSRHLESADDRKWFLIVDNADDDGVLYGSQAAAKVGIDQYLPTTENCIVVFTTRSRDVALSVADTDVIELGEMSLEEATSFFSKAIIHGESVKDSQLVAALLEELTRLPLAIVQAAAYLNRNRLSVERYLELLRSTEGEMVSLMSIEYPGSHNAVASTWLVSFDQIRQTDPIAADLLLFMSLIEPRAIPYSLLPPAQTEAEMEQAIGTLCGYTFLADRGDRVYDMHRLVHIAAKIWNRNQHPMQTTNGALRHVEAIFPSTNQANRELWRSYIPHTVRLLEESDSHDNDERYDLFFRVGKCLYEDRRFKEAIRCLEQTHRWRTARKSEDDDSRLAVEHSLASAYIMDRQIEKAITMLEHVTKVRTGTLNEEDHDRLASEHELAKAYLNNGQIEKAITILKHVIKIRTQTLNEKDHARLASEYELARAYLEDGRVTEAIKLLEHVVAIEADLLTEDNPDRVASIYLLRRAYKDLENGSTAIAQLRVS